MADEIYLARLDEIVTDLGDSITDFKEASEITRGIANAVSIPMGRGELMDRVEDFERDWDGTREELIKNLEVVFQHLSDVKAGFEEWDLETKKAFLNSRSSDAPPAK